MDYEFDNNEKSSQLLKESQKREIEKVLNEAATQALLSYSIEYLNAAKNSKIKPQVSQILHKKKRGGLRSRHLTTNFCLQYTPHAPSCQYSPLDLAEKMIGFLPYHWNAHAASPGFINFKYPKINQKSIQINQQQSEMENNEYDFENHHFQVSYKFL